MFDLLQSKPTKLVVASLLTAGLGTTMGSSVLAGSAAASSQTIITVNNNAGEPLTNNFNPLVPTSTLDFYGSWSMIYEPLVQYDVQKPGVTYPWLATSWKWSNGNKTLVFELRHGVKWSDGQPFTSKDVVFTFDLMKKYPSVNLYGLDFTGVTAQGAYQVTMKFPASNYTDFYYAAELSPIIPEHVWSTISNPATYADTNPLGPALSSSSLSTPRTSSSSPTRATGSAACPKIYGLEYVAGTAQSLTNLTDDETLDWSSGGTPGAQAWEKKNPYNHYWFPGAGVVSIEPNLTKWPLNQLAVREAISLALNRSVIGSQGEFGYEDPVLSATGLLPSQSNFVVSQFKNDLLKYDPSQAKKVLEQAGWKAGPGGTFEDNAGKQLAFTISDPSGFVDYITDCQLMREELKAAGMALTCEGTSTNAWTSDVASGEFDATIRWSDYGNGDPFYIYNGWLNHNLTAPVGGTASDDFERYGNSSAQAALQTYTTAPTSAAEQVPCRPSKIYSSQTSR